MKKIHLDLHRTFIRSGEASKFDEEDWSAYLGDRRRQLQWSDLIAQRVVVVLGEAGMGKTSEFADQVRRLQAQGKSAFFLPLSLVTSSDAFVLALGDQKDEFDTWLISDQPGYVFLDAVDESCLSGLVAFEHALGFIINALTPHLDRVSVFLSSRISDWQLAAVRDVVDRRVLASVIRTLPRTKHRKEGASVREEKTSATDLHVEVVRLARLSEIDSKRLAEAHNAVPVEAFWRDVEDGDYQRWAGRPRDVEWMARRWSKLGQLGSYCDLLEASISQHLSEKNESYIAAGAVLSAEMMRRGAEQLSAASVFCGKAFVSMPGEEPGPADLAPCDALPDWDANMQRRLLGSALFDEATYGRVKFHHRTDREYLAACWIAQRLQDGLPLEDAIRLFGGKSYGEPVLLNRTRATLCWLATLSAPVRERVIQYFPEMLMFEGDPDAWSDADVIDGFQGYIRRLDSGFRPDWWNDSSELRRVARRLPLPLLNDLLKQYPDSVNVTGSLLSLISQGRITGCADEVFRLYRSDSRRSRFQLYALEVLVDIATNQQRAEIKADLTGGQIDSNEMLAAGLKVTKIEALALDELIGIFEKAKTEEEYGTGPMAKAVSRAMSKLDLNGSLLVLEALFRVLPNGEHDVDRMRPGEVRERDAWKLRILPQCLLRVVDLLPSPGDGAPAVVKQAALYVEQLQHTRFARDEDYEALREAIEKKAGFRKDLILAIANAGRAESAPKRLLWGRGQISIRPNELDSIIELSNRLDSTSEAQFMWFRIAVELAINLPSPEEQEQAFNKMIGASDTVEARNAYIERTKADLAAAVWQRKQWEASEGEREKRDAEQMARNKEELLNIVDSIRDGTNFNAIHWLAEQGERRNYTRVSVEPIREGFGEEIAAAFSDGLTALWRHHDEPDILEYPGNEVPWLGLIGLASVNHAVALGLDVLSLSDDDVRKAVRLCVWELEAAPTWLSVLCRDRTDVVIAAVRPWFEHELRSSTRDATWFRTVDLVSKTPIETRAPLVEVGVNLLLAGTVDSLRLQERIVDDGIKLEFLDRAAVKTFAVAKLDSSHDLVSEQEKQKWLGVWLAFDFAAGWAWIEGHASVLQTNSQGVALSVAKALAGQKWSDRLSGSVEELSGLTAMFGLLSSHADPLDSDDIWGTNPIGRIREAIPSIIGNLPGLLSHNALVQLETDAGNKDEAQWIHRSVVSHAIAEAERRSVIRPNELMAFGEAYCRDPRTGHELFEQVMARLRQVKTCLENGPFSDRDLFEAGMDEKLLQLWLAARLNDTPQRKFSTRFVVHREPEVDDDKRTDIEVSTRGFKVCIEIKPVDFKRYSATTLSDTLRNQLLNQYLKGGQNSRHGILVLFRLDTKAWKIPGGPVRGTFGQLVSYLKQRAGEVILEFPEVETIDVIGIDCTYYEGG